MNTIISLIIIGTLVYGMYYLSKKNKSPPNAIDNPPVDEGDDSGDDNTPEPKP